MHLHTGKALGEKNFNATLIIQYIRFMISSSKWKELSSLMSKLNFTIDNLLQREKSSVEIKFNKDQYT